MRDILFRGQDENGKWYEGQLIKNKLGYFISTEENPHYCREYGYIELDNPIKVKPETVGQFTGLTDKNGVSIFSNGQLLRIKYFMGENNEYYCDCIYKTNELTFEGVSLSFVRLFNQEPDSKQNSYPIDNTLSFKYGTLGVDYRNQNYNRCAIMESTGKNHMSRNTWKENNYSNDIEVIGNTHMTQNI